MTKSRKRLDVLARQVVVTPRQAEGLAEDAGRLQFDLRELADRAPDVGTKGAIEAMADHARALERRFTEASASDE